MTKQELSDQLYQLANRMKEMATAIDYYGGGNPEWKSHSKELSGAAMITETWAEGMLSEIQEKQNICLK